MHPILQNKKMIREEKMRRGAINARIT